MTDIGPKTFGSPVLLKCKADEITADVPPPLPQPSLPPPVSKQARHNCDHDMLLQMWALLRTGARWLDTLRGAQMAAQEASGVMATAMLWQQGAMREVSTWESEVEGAMREMARRVEGEELDL